MSTLDLIPDAPGLLRAESINITLKFERTGPSTGRVSWNIPTPAAGCTADTQAYCGMLVTIDTTSTNATKIPKNGQVYSSDATADANLFAGDKLGTAFVIGAFYNDRETKFFDIDGLMPNTPYYVTGFPMDCQYRYFVEGVHAYSQDFTNRGHEGTNGSQVVILNPSTNPQQGVKPTDYTGLMPGIKYDFSIQLGVVPKPITPVRPTDCVPTAPTYTIEVDGTYAQTYEDLVSSINKQFGLLKNCAQGPYAPNTGGYYWNGATQKLYQWNGSAHVEIPVIIDVDPPNLVPVGTYWLNTTTNVLSFWNGTTWVTVTVIDYSSDPTAPIADKSYWFDGVQAYLWNGATWCPVMTFVQTTDPSLGVLPVPGSYWYDLNGGLFKWNGVLELWEATTAVQSEVDPNALAVGSYWFDETRQKLFALNTPNPGWNEQSNVAVTETEPTTPAPGKYWYNPSDESLKQRNQANTAWVDLDVISFPVDPTVRSYCDLWWDIANDVLNTWDGVHGKWVPVAKFYQQATDPSAAPVMQEGWAWYNPDTKVLQIWVNNCWKPVDYIFWERDPTTCITLGTVWHDTKNNKWYVKDMSGWTEISPVKAGVDPRNLPTGTFWFNPSNLALQMWNGVSWVSVTYSTTPLTPATGSCWFDTSTGILKEWNGVGWVKGTPIATVELDCRGNLLFTDTTVGSYSYVQITDGSLFKSLDAPNKLDNPKPGTDGASDVPSYDELGIGTDGNDAIRAEIMNEIRYELGYPIMTVELTKEQLDYAITKALEELRSRSSIAYKRGFYFMRILPNTQHYYLTNKIQGMNKIVDILGVYRMNSSYLASAHGAGVYGQIVMQHMYNMGTFDLLSFHLMGEYTSLMEQLFSTRITFNWNEQTRHLQLYTRFPESEPVVSIEATVERTEQDIMTDRYARTWIRKYAAATARLMLAEIRGKYSTLPGAGGSVSLNSADLRQAAQTALEQCIQEIEDYVVDKPDEYGMGTQFLFG